MKIKNKTILSYNDISNFNFYNYSNFCNYNFKNYEYALKHYIKFGYNLFNKPKLDLIKNSNYDKDNIITFFLIFNNNYSIKDLNKCLNRIEQLYQFYYDFEIIIININRESIKDKLNTNLLFKEFIGDRIDFLFKTALQKIIGNIVLIQSINLFHNIDIVNTILKKIKIDNFLNFYDCKKMLNPIRNYSFAILKENLDLININFKRLENFEINNILIQLKHNLKLNTLNIKSDFTILKNIECQLSNVKNNKLLTLHNYNKTKFPKTLFLYWDKPSLPLINLLTIESFNK